MNRQLDFTVRRFVYERTLRTGVPPSLADLAAATATSRAAASASLERLARGRVLVLQPQSGEILMAPPFSAVPTPFAVETEHFSCFGNCIWDALGIAAMLRRQAKVRTHCGDCAMAMDVWIDTETIDGKGLVHFAVPARDWWQDIVFS